MRKKGVWMFGENFIANGIGYNYTVALVMAKFHLAALKANIADPDWAAREVIFAQLYNNLLGQDLTKSDVISDRMIEKGNLDEMFQEIIDIDLPLWQNQIAAIRPRKSTIYKVLMKGGHASFEEGRIEDKIKRVQQLASTTLADGSLSTVSALILAKWTLLDKTRNLQLGYTSTVKTTISTQRAAIDAMTDAHFTDHGIAVSKNPKSPKAIAAFTDVKTLQQHEHSLTYNTTVNAKKVKTAFTRKYTVTTNFLITSTVDITVWVIDSAKNIIKPTGVFVAATIPTNVGFPAAGDVTKRVFQVQNMTAVKGLVQIVIS